MRIRFSDSAERDLEAIFDYIAADSPVAAQRMVDRLILAAYQLENFPLLGRPGSVENTREWSVSGTNYFIVYEILDEYHVDIEAIIHVRQRYPG